MIEHLAHRNAAAALAELDAAVDEGVDVGQLLEQLLGYFRDCMAAAAGCPADAVPLRLRRQQPTGGRGRESGWACRPSWRPCRFSIRPFPGCATAPRAASWPSWPWCGLCQLEELDEIATWIGQLQAGVPAVIHGAGAGQSAAPRGDVDPEANASAR